MTGSRPSSKAWSSVSGPVLHAPPPLATPPVTVTHTTVPTEPSLLHSNSPYRSARINNTAALRFSGFDAGPRIRPPIAFEEDSRNGTGGAANARGIGIVKPPGLRAHLRASTVHARTRLYLVVERAALHARIHANTGIGMHDRGGGYPSAQRTLPAICGPYQMRPSIRAPFTLQRLRRFLYLTFVEVALSFLSTHHDFKSVHPTPADQIRYRRWAAASENRFFRFFPLRLMAHSFAFRGHERNRRDDVELIQRIFL